MSYRTDDALRPLYEQFPEQDDRPLIGLSANYKDGEACLTDRYYKQVVAAGGIPVLIPPVGDARLVADTLQRLDGIILTGGGDYNPLWCGEAPSPRLHGINAERDLPELLLTRLAYNRQLPMLGICRGIQTLAMALDGRVMQDIEEAMPAETVRLLKHSQDAARDERTHLVTIQPDTLLYNIYNGRLDEGQLSVNSFHHQAVAETGPRFRVTARATDGVIEAIESAEHKPVIGVQWHPEWLGDEGLLLFRWLTEEARLFARAKDFHRRHLTLDTHCDTPMFFPQGIRFDRRDERILTDLHKMTDGRLDATTMVAYLPQSLAGGDTSPRQYADNIFDKIDEIVTKNDGFIALARTPEEALRNKRAGRKSIFTGIENGLAIEDDIRNVAHFAGRGIVYITLCHNGDNRICDSASKTENTHGGVSDFGAEVIREMNRLGIMVDLSHGGEKSFYDALDISSMPIVCSHSNCRALCDHPRNLTDEQLRALARKGGVAHTTLYHGFLRKDGEATILDALSHLEHAISIMGIDHVGLGTDFDGDGGVTGFADASEALQWTMHLLRRRYSEENIRKIWGGNWLRVMQQVQQNRKTT